MAHTDWVEFAASGVRRRDARLPRRWHTWLLSGRLVGQDTFRTGELLLPDYEPIRVRVFGLDEHTFCHPRDNSAELPDEWS